MIIGEFVCLIFTNNFNSKLRELTYRHFSCGNSSGALNVPNHENFFHEYPSPYASLCM